MRLSNFTKSACENQRTRTNPYLRWTDLDYKFFDWPKRSAAHCRLFLCDTGRQLRISITVTAPLARTCAFSCEQGTQGVSMPSAAIQLSGPRSTTSSAEAHCWTCGRLIDASCRSVPPAESRVCTHFICCMQAALRLATKAGALGEVPIGLSMHT